MHPQITSKNLMNHVIDLIETGPDRNTFLLQYLAGKRVLHIGCTGYPRFEPDTNLHIVLSKGELAALHGLDIDARGVEKLREYVNQPMFTEYDQVTESYDVVLVPEVMEHVLDVGLFLKQLMSLDTHEVVITVPNAIDVVQNNMNLYGWADVDGKRQYIETTHEDHCYYFTPMTLAAVTRKAIARYGDNAWQCIGLFQSQVSIGCILRRKGSGL